MKIKILIVGLFSVAYSCSVFAEELVIPIRIWENGWKPHSSFERGQIENPGNLDIRCPVTADPDGNLICEFECNEDKEFSVSFELTPVQGYRTFVAHDPGGRLRMSYAEIRVWDCRLAKRPILVEYTDSRVLVISADSLEYASELIGVPQYALLEGDVESVDYASALFTANDNERLPLASAVAATWADYAFSTQDPELAVQYRAYSLASANVIMCSVIEGCSDISGGYASFSTNIESLRSAYDAGYITSQFGEDVSFIVGNYLDQYQLVGLAPASMIELQEIASMIEAAQVQ